MTILEQHGTATGNRLRILRKDADQIRDAINCEFWDKSREAYRDSIHADGIPSDVFSVQTQIMSVLADVVPSERRQRVETLIVEPAEGMVTIGSPFMSFFLYRFLVDQGRSADVLSVVRQKWGDMMDEGSTTCWETFRGVYTDRLTRSYCHAWSAAPAWYLPEILLGVQREAPGWDSVSIRPRAEGISWARGTVITPHGPVHVQWSRDENGQLEVHTSVPEGVAVTAGSISVRDAAKVAGSVRMEILFGIAEAERRSLQQVTVGDPIMLSIIDRVYVVPVQ
jgi:hypothetical protein